MGPALGAGETEVQRWERGNMEGAGIWRERVWHWDWEGLFRWPVSRLFPSVGGGGLASQLFPQAGSAPAGGTGGVEFWRQVAFLSGGQSRGWLSFCCGPEPPAPLFRGFSWFSAGRKPSITPLYYALHLRGIKGGEGSRRLLFFRFLLVFPPKGCILWIEVLKNSDRFLRRRLQSQS